MKMKEKKQKQKRGVQITTSQDKRPAAGSPRPVGIRSKWEDYAGYFLVVQSMVISTCHSLNLNLTLTLTLTRFLGAVTRQGATPADIKSQSSMEG